jgi:ribosomal protein S18 acetylase RimI-like enzyme
MNSVDDTAPIPFGVLDLARGLSPDALSALATLEADVVSADGGRLKLEWSVLGSRPGDIVEDVLWWEEGRLVGFLGLYSFGGSPVELSGMVHPTFRRRGIGTRLLDEAMALSRARGHDHVLLVTPRASPGARIMAESRRGVLDHSEHAMDLEGAPTEVLSDPSLTLRTARSDDAFAMDQILTEAFGHSPGPLNLEEPGQSVLVAEHDGEVIATLRVSKSTDSWGIYGLAVDSKHRGAGVGRDLLGRVCRQANENGVTRLHLEVEVNNDRALGLYTSLGFTRTTTEDYFAIPL